MKRSLLPKISVVMPAYNSEEYVAEAIESILNQTYEDFEFIIVDDGSHDGTADIVRRYAGMDPKIRPFFMPHGGLGYAANICVANARARWIARMDSDDIALPHRLAAQIGWIEANDLDVCGSLVQTTGSRADIFWFPEQQEAIQREMLFRVGVMQPAIMGRAAIFRSNPYNESVSFDDYEIWSRLTTKFKMGNIQEILIQYRCHDLQTHVVQQDLFRSDFKKYRFRYFYELYPNTPLQDYLALARVSDKQPMTSISELRRAGRWLVDLADHPDLKLRQKMAGRWEDTCKRSKALGDECEAVFQEYMAMIQPH